MLLERRAAARLAWLCRHTGASLLQTFPCLPKQLTQAELAQPLCRPDMILAASWLELPISMLVIPAACQLSGG